MAEAVAAGGMGDFRTALLESLSLVWATELGDKTFFIAALLAMQYNGFAVFSGAFGALVVMTILSAFVGHWLPNFMPRSFTNLAAAGLFAFFGLKMLKEAREMGAGTMESQADEERKDASETIKARGVSLDVETGGEPGGSPTHPAPKGRPFQSFKSPLIAQAFTLTFLAEWGDRSQIATIGLASVENPYGVVLGGMMGHFICTGIAVVGGSYLSKRISLKTVNYLGGLLFLFFAIVTLLSQKLPSASDKLVSLPPALGGAAKA